VTLFSAAVVGAEKRPFTVHPKKEEFSMNLFNHALRRRHAAAILMSMAIAVAYANSPQRLDLYDKDGNSLMFVTFEYENQKNVSRTVYMSDSTFVRKTFITYDLQGNRVRESSLNFNSDTSYVSEYQHRGDTAMFSIRDIFGVDQMGGRVRYLTNDSLSFTFSYQTAGSSVTYVIGYEKNQQGDLAKVTVSDYAQGKLFSGFFSYSDSPVRTLCASGKKQVASVELRNAKILDLGLNLEKPSLVKCCLVSLSGRRAGVLFEGRLAGGAQSRSLRLSGLGHLAEGVYMLTVSVDGAAILKTKYLFQHSSLGGVQ
jgi:hypothetical protein